MDQQALANLTDAERARYAALENLFGHPGWKIVEEWATASLSQEQARQLQAGTWETVMFQRGKASVFAELLALPDTTENEFAARAAQAAEAKQTHDEADYE